MAKSHKKDRSEHDTLLRLIVTLRLIPFAPRKISPKELAEKLRREGFRVHERTVQRDLKRLESAFGLRVDDRVKPYGWQWPEGSKGVEIPSMEPSVALTFKLVEEILAPLLPTSALERLDIHFERAEKVLNEIAGKTPRLAEKIAAVPRNQRLLAPTVSPQILQTVYDALLTRRCLDVKYRARGQQPKNYQLNPLGLVYRDNVIYLLAGLWDYQDPAQFALHRFEEAALSKKRANEIEGFHLKDYVAAGEFDFPHAGPETFSLVALFDEEIAAHLYETPLSNDQAITSHRSGRMKVTATVQNTGQLRWWLMGFGPNVEVVAPKWLRREFSEQIADLAQIYSRK